MTDAGSLPDPRREDAELCEAVLSGNMDAFARLAGKYRKRILALGMSFFHDQDDAEDFLQDVLVKVYTSLSGFRGEARFSTWLMRVAYNTAINSVKRNKVYVSLAEDFDVPDTSETPEEESIRRGTGDAIKRALDILPERYRVCVDLFFYYDMPYADISVVTGLPVNTIKSHVFRAKKMLKEALAEGEEL